MALTPPTTPTVPLSIYTPSGTAQPEGFVDGPNVFSGNWWITRQWMNISYSRVPATYTAGSKTPGAGCTLSAINSPAPFNGTMLAATVYAFVEQVSSAGTYATSSYQQPQKFAIYAGSADPQGLTYPGTSATTLPSGCLGPLGDIITVQEFYRREPLSSVDPWITRNQGASSVHGPTYVARWLPGGTDIFSPSALNSVDYFRDFAAWARRPGHSQSNRHKEDVDLLQVGIEYYIPGGYNYDKEISQKTITLIDSMAARVKVLTGNYAIPGVYSWVHTSYYNGWPFLPPANFPNPGDPSHPTLYDWYDVNRHDYSEIPNL